MTLFTTVYDFFLVKVRDYELDELYTTNQNQFYLTLEGILISAVPQFYNARTSLDYTLDGGDPSLSQFDNTLSKLEQVILSEWMIITWLRGQINDITQFNLHLQSADFKTYAEANNLDKKKELLNESREEVEKLMNRYGWSNPNVEDLL